MGTTSDNLHYEKFVDGTVKCIEEEIPFEILDCWEWSRLLCVSDIVTGGTPSKAYPNYYGGDFPFFKPTDLEQAKNVLHASKYLTDEGKKQCRIVPKSSTSVYCIGSIGKVGQLQLDGATNQQINTIKKYAAIWEKEILEGSITNNRQRFDDYCKYVIKQKELNGIKPSTIERYRQLCDRTFAYLGHIKLKDLRVQNINDFYLNLQNNQKNKKTNKPLSSTTIHRYHEFISTILTQAYKEGLIINKIADRATPPKVITKDPKALEPNELEKILEVIETEPIKWGAIISLLIDAGVRRGELLGLKWNVVDLNRGEIEICNNVLQEKGKGIYESTPKTKSSYRKIVLTEPVVEILKEYKTWQMSERIRLGSYYRNRDFVFTQDNGNPMSPDSVSNYCYKDLSKKCGFPIHPHIFRHSQATILAHHGIDPVSISKRLGHAQVSTTMNIYASAFRKGDAEVSKAIQDILYKKA